MSASLSPSNPAGEGQYHPRHIISARVKLFLKRSLEKNKSLIIHEARHFSRFLELLMKQRNTGVGWTKEDIKQIKSSLMRLSLTVPVLIIFLLPFGSLLLPLLAEIMDRRKGIRTKK